MDAQANSAGHSSLNGDIFRYARAVALHDDGVDSKPVIAFDFGYPRFERRVPLLMAQALGFLMFDMHFPLLDGRQIAPVRDGDAHLVSGGLHAKKPRLLRGQRDHALGHVGIPLITLGANGGEDHGVVGWLRGVGNHGEPW